MAALQIEFFNELENASHVKPGTDYAIAAVRNGVTDSIQAVSKIYFGKFESSPHLEGRHIFFQETGKNVEIEEALKKSIDSEIIDMTMFLGKLPHPPSGRYSSTRYFIALPYEAKKEFSNHAMHYGNEISIVSTHDLVKDFQDNESGIKRVYDRGFVLGAHMMGHLMLPNAEEDEDDGHCKEPTCCMHPHLSGVTDIDKIIEARSKKNKRKVFCKKSLEKFDIYLEMLSHDIDK